MIIPFGYNLQLEDHTIDVDTLNVPTMESSNLTEITLVDRTGHVDTVTDSQHTVVRGRRTTTLNMAKRRGAHVAPGALLSPRTNNLTNAVGGLVTELIDTALFVTHGVQFQDSALGDGDNAVLPTCPGAAFHRFHDLIDIEWLFRNDNVMGTTGHTRM